MKTTFTTTKPDDIEMTLTVTMSLKHWNDLRALLPEDWPAWELRGAITDMVVQANKTFYPKEKGAASE
jgi:hypothetical protein